jgi:hypothetical protein
MNRTPEILAQLRDAIQSAPPAELPAIIGQVEAIKAEAFVRLATPAQPEPSTPEPDRFLTVEDVVARMGQGTTSKWVRAHASELGLVRMTGRRLRFSEQKLARILRMRAEG